MDKLGNIFKGFRNLLTGKEAPLQKKRLKICGKCPHLKQNKRCAKCNCYMPAKTAVPGAKCPLRKW